MPRRRSTLAAAMGGARAKDDPERDLWRTPPRLFEPLRDELGLDLDAAANRASALCERAYCEDRGEDALVLPWAGRVFVNPPFSKLPAWAERARAEALRHSDGHRAAPDLIAFVCPARTETGAFKLLGRCLGREIDSRALSAGRVGDYTFIGWAIRGTAGDVEVRLLSPRVQYLRPDGSPSNKVAYGSAVVILRPNAPEAAP